MNKVLLVGTAIVAGLAFVAGGFAGYSASIIALGLCGYIKRKIDRLRETRDLLNKDIDKLALDVEVLTDQNTKAEAIACRYLAEREEFKQKAKNAEVKVKELQALTELAVVTEITTEDNVVTKIKSEKVKPTEKGKVTKKKIIK